MDVKILGGFTKETATTNHEDIETEDEFDIAIYNQTFIVAIPKPGANTTHLKFEVALESEEEEEEDGWELKLIIAVGITGGAMLIFGIGMVVYYYWIKIKRW